MKTVVVNFIGSPSAGKTTMCALLFAELKMLHQSVEIVPEFAKRLVWLERFDLLNNQHYVTSKQYRYLKSMKGKVRFILTDGSLLLGIHYNKSNKNNICNVVKLEGQIIEWINDFDNIYIHLERGEYEYDQAGRIETEQESNQVNLELIKIMDNLGVQYKSYKSDRKHIPEILDHVLGSTSSDSVS